MAVADSYANRRDEINSSADAITSELKKADRFIASNEMLTTDVLNHAMSALAGNFDSANGGFGGAPKFPPSMTLMFILRQHARTKSPDALKMIETTLQKMAAGGIYDHLGGGLARYSVDGHWLVPHFEKMLYDNALLIRVYLYAYQQTHNPTYRRVAEETLEYVIRDLTDRSGGFYSSEDADSEGVEGKFYVWTRDEVLKVLGPDGPLFCEFFDVSDEGNFEHGTSILNIPESIEDFAASHNLKSEELKRSLESAKRKLFTVREQRVRPGLDDKTLASWNGLMLTAFAEAANVLDRDDYRQVAIRNAEFIISELMRDGRLLRTYKGGKAKLNAYLEDYSYVIEGLLAVYEATFDLKFFNIARRLADAMIEHFYDEQDGGFYFTSSDHEELIVRTKDYFDNATPSGNSAAAMSLLKLGLLRQDQEYTRRGVAVLRALRPALQRYPNAFGYTLCALDFYLSEPKEIALIGNLASHEIRSFVEQIYSDYYPNKIIAACEPGDESSAEQIRLLVGRTEVNRNATAYVCRQYVCLQPAITAEELKARLEDQ